MSTESDKTRPDILVGPSREKYWTELDDAGKVERLHTVVKELQRQLERVGKTANDAHRVAESHEHSQTGEVMMPVDSFNRGESTEAARRRDEKWF